ncbi:hypothetical protein NHQ30_008013 [Ciborinia camelliae]|nr:hypothetical protein NHQ30_008013 [Ciborinia camelliae]
MPTIEQQVKDERRVSYLLWKAIDSQLELEKATQKLMKDIYKDLKKMGAAGGPSKDWRTMCAMAQQLVDTVQMLRGDEERESVVGEDSVEIKVDEKIKIEEETEEEIEKYIEELMKEIHPNLDQIKATLGLEEEDPQVVLGLAKQMAKPFKFFLGDEEEEADIWEKEDSNGKKERAPSSSKDNKAPQRILYNDFQEDGCSIY